MTSRRSIRLCTSMARCGRPSRQADYDRGIRLAERSAITARMPSLPLEQASVLRNLVVRAEAVGMEYNIVEAIDQPRSSLKAAFGPYWGILKLHASRSSRELIVDQHYWKIATIAVLVRLPDAAPDLPVAQSDGDAVDRTGDRGKRRRGLERHRLRLLNTHYFVFGPALALTLGLILLVPLVPNRYGPDRVKSPPLPLAGRLPASDLVGAPAPASATTSSKAPFIFSAYFEPPRDDEDDPRCGGHASTTLNFECAAIID